MVKSQNSYPNSILFHTEDMGFEPTHAMTRLPRFQHGLLSLLSNLPRAYPHCIVEYGAGGSRTHVQTHANLFVYNHRLCLMLTSISYIAQLI